jgi:rhodanese-related sulfurtransferase
MPVNEFDARIGKFIEMYPFTEFIVTYCSGRECDDSHKLAQKLFEVGYTNISVFIDGYPGWKTAGYPVEAVVKSSGG